MRILVFRDTVIDTRGTGEIPLKGALFICPVCGDTWGRARLSGFSQFAVATTPCELHGDRNRIGGSFLTGLSLWDRFPGGATKTAQTESAGLGLLTHEALMLANEILKETK